MGINLNTALYKSQGIDLASVQNVANNILEGARQSSVEPKVQTIDYSKFNRKALGIDLYSSRTNVDLQKQIALTQAGLYLQSVDVAKLNSMAAMNLYSANKVQSQVELTQSVQDNELIAPKRLEEAKNIIKSYNTSDKNPNSHNSFNPFNNGEEAKEDKE